MNGKDPYADGGDRAPIDAHVHFWDPDRLSYPWLSGAPGINRRFTPQDFRHALPEPVDAIFVEAGRADHLAVDELDWVRQEAVTRPWIRGAVAHAPLEDRAASEALIGAYAEDPFVVGVRRNVQDEEAGFMNGADFRAGVAMLGAGGLSFDACVRTRQLPELAELAGACPQTVIVLDHLGKPSAGRPDPSWQQAMIRLATHGNVVCKLSGLATEAPLGASPGLIISTLREALQVFGPGRCLYGGDWPVMTLATSYGTWLELVRTALADFDEEATDAVLRTNAIRTYRLDRASASPRSSTRKEGT
jgi:L-fuconolactonase